MFRTLFHPCPRKENRQSPRTAQGVASKPWAHLNPLTPRLSFMAVPGSRGNRQILFSVTAPVNPKLKIANRQSSLVNGNGLDPLKFVVSCSGANGAFEKWTMFRMSQVI